MEKHPQDVAALDPSEGTRGYQAPEVEEIDPTGSPAVTAALQKGSGVSAPREL